MDMEEIGLLSSRLRKAIEACPKTVLPITFDSFPSGACGDASLVLGAWLEDNGYSGFEYVCGVLKLGEFEYQSHAWLELNGTIVDITADQFRVGMPTVYVGPSTPFYQQFEIDIRHLGHLHMYDERTRLCLQAAYLAVKRYI